jgi:hypothetical protein
VMGKEEDVCLDAIDAVDRWMVGLGAARWPGWTCAGGQPFGSVAAELIHEGNEPWDTTTFHV